MYHAILEAFNGYCRGQIALGTILRSTGLTYSIVRENNSKQLGGDWLAVCLYGSIGAPRKGFEHEAIGLGINSI